MNKCIFVGRMGADPETRYTQSGVLQCTFRIAVQRQFKNAQGNYDVDWIQCVAWRNTAEFVGRYLSKGDQVAVCGSLQNRQYQAQDGSKRYVTEIMVEQVQGCGKTQGKTEVNAAEHQSEAVNGGFTEVDDEELPF